MLGHASFIYRIKRKKEIERNVEREREIIVQWFGCFPDEASNVKDATITFSFSERARYKVRKGEVQ